MSDVLLDWVRKGPPLLTPPVLIKRLLYHLRPTGFPWWASTQSPKPQLIAVLLYTSQLSVVEEENAPPVAFKTMLLRMMELTISMVALG